MAEAGNMRDTSESGWVHRHSSSSSRHSPVQYEHASVETCRVMTWLGYGPQIRQARRQAYRELGSHFTARSHGMLVIFIAGSKAEGLTCYYESDRDLIFVLDDVMCLEDDCNASNLPRETTVLKLNNNMIYPGHCRLLLDRRSTHIPPHLYRALCDDGSGSALLSSDLFVHELQLPPGQMRQYRAGPSLSSVTRAFQMDTVFALKCHCPSILQRWADRPRLWPPPDIVKKVVSMGAFVTPVGYKQSEYKHVEWRICFNTGETELVSNLNDTQVKLYVILKMVKTDVLNPLRKEVTSYTVKNIVLWLAEKNPQAMFHDKSLFYWLHEALKELRTAISSLHLPYYMIPERDLMASSGIKDEQQRIWVATITDMMNEGPRIVLRLKKIRQAVVSHPGSLFWYGGRRMELELLQLEAEKRSEQCKDEDGKVDFIMQSLGKRMIELVMEVRQRMHMEGTRVNDFQSTYEGMMM